MLNSHLMSHGFRLVPIGSKPLLLSRPIPDAKEGFGEYLTRLCSENHLDGPAALARRVGLSYSQLVGLGSDVFREILCGRARLVSPRPGEIVGSISGRAAFVRGIRTQSRICPRCFSDGDVADKSWSWPLSLACGRHGCWLMEKCPRCSKGISLLRRRQFVCDCGYNYRLAQVQEAEHWLGNFYEIFSPRRFELPQDGEEILESDQKAYLILRSLLASNEKKLDALQRPVTGAALSLMRFDQLDRLREMMLNWATWIPQRIGYIADANIQSAKRLIRQMEELGSSELVTVASGATEALDAKRRSDRLTERLEDRRIRSFQELSRVTGLHVRTINGLIATGYFKDCSITKGESGFSSVVMSEEESQRIRQLYESSLSVQEAAQAIDSSALHVKIFAKANALKAVLRHSNYVGTWRFSIDGLNDFLDSLLKISGTVAEDIKSEELTPLGKLAIKHHSGRPNPNWVHFAGRIVAGEIPIFRVENGRGLNAFAISTANLPRARKRG